MEEQKEAIPSPRDAFGRRTSEPPPGEAAALARWGGGELSRIIWPTETRESNRGVRSTQQVVKSAGGDFVGRPDKNRSGLNCYQEKPKTGLLFLCPDVQPGDPVGFPDHCGRSKSVPLLSS